MDTFAAALLGLVQALTEFLPVSSSGHLVLGKALLGVKTAGGAAFEVAVHFGTLLSVMVLFRRDIAELTRAAFAVARAPASAARAWREDPRVAEGVAIVLGCVPAGVIGILFEERLEAAFSDPRLVSAALLFTGAVLLATRFARPAQRPITLSVALAIGVAQALAILPGISRSGSTIAAALFLGVDRLSAGRFSFLLSVPVILGATLLKARDLLADPPGADVLGALAIGAAVSFVAGLGALALLMRLLRGGRFADFGWYCLAVGAAGLMLL